MRGDLRGAVADATAALGIDPRDSDALVGRGSAFRLLGDADKALADYDEATRIAPDLAGAWLDRGAVLLQKGELPEAIASFDKTIALNPRSVEAYNNRGAAESQTGDFARAALDLDTALRLGPNSEEAFGNRAFVRLALGDYAGAAEDFEALATHDPTDPYRILWRHLARLRAGFADESFARDASTFPPDPWPGALLALYAGSLDRGKVLGLAPPPEAAARVERRCEMVFYVGEYALTHDDRGGATVLIREAAETCPVGFLERAAAIGELKRLEP
jgi:lipoprotein NlpI